MSASWHNFLYHAFDPAGFISVDKPPGAMWIQVASVKLFSFHGLSILLPQVLEGLAAVWLVFHLVQRRFGKPAGLLAALFLALTPVSVAVDRSSNTESCLVLVLLLAAWALSRAAEEGHRGYLLLALALVGLAFNVKMLAAFVVLPTFALVYLLGAPRGPRRRLVDATLGAIVLAIVSLSWIGVYDLTPAASRPYAGTTDTNSELELVIGPYGIGRFVRQTRPSAADATAVAPARAPLARTSGEGETSPGPRRGVTRLFVGAPAGALRLADGQLAGQVAWLLPLALAGLVLGAVREPWRRPLAPSLLALLLWSGWGLTYAIVFSAAGGFFHFYYMAMLAPPLAALSGLGAVSLWRLALAGGPRAILVALTLLVTAAWQLYIEVGALAGYDGWQVRLHGALVVGALLAALALTVLAFPGAAGRARGLATSACGVGLAALLLAPLAWALSSVLAVGSGALPSADLARLLIDGRRASGQARRQIETSDNVARLVAFLNANRGGERYLLSTSTTSLAAPIIIRSGEAVMARGGFHGLDPILTPAKLADMVTARQVRFVMLGDLSAVSRRLGAETAQRPIIEWVRAHGSAVDSGLWRASGGGVGNGMALYDLRPDTALVPVGSDG